MRQYFETKCYVYPSYRLEHRHKRLSLSSEDGLLIARLMDGRWVSAEELEGIIGRSPGVPVHRLNVLLEGWCLEIERKDDLYRAVERRPKHRV